MKKEITFRAAVEQDLEKIVQMLSDDPLGSKRERYQHPLPDSYLKAFKAIAADPNNELIVACDGDEVIGVQQLLLLPISHIREGGEQRWKASEHPKL